MANERRVLVLDNENKFNEATVVTVMFSVTYTTQRQIISVRYSPFALILSKIPTIKNISRAGADTFSKGT